MEEKKENNYEEVEYVKEKYEILVKVSSDQIECFVEVKAKPDEMPPEIEDIYEKMKEKEINTGIIEENIQNLVEEKKWDQDVLVAKGTSPVHGTDASIEHLIDFKSAGKPKVDDRGNVNFYEINAPFSVKEGEKLAVKHPPVDGTDGISVRGEPVKAKPPRDLALPSGKNTIIDPDDPNYLIASIDGLVRLKDKKFIEVDPVYEVKGDVDFNTGNINFIGAVKIKGDVKSGFKINSEGNVEIDGVVEDATIEAGGDVIIKMGFIGRGNGLIKSGGSVFLKYCDNQKIDAEKDIVVSEYIINGIIRAGEKVIVTGKTGVIVGGEIIALKGIEVKTLGSKQHIKTSLYLGITEDLKNRYNEIIHELLKGQENIKHIDEGISILTKISLLKKGLSAEKQEILEKLKKAKATLTEQKKELTEERKKILEELQNFKSASLKVFNEVHPNVRIHIYNRKYINQYEVSKVEFYYSQNSVEYKPIE